MCAVSREGEDQCFCPRGYTLPTPEANNCIDINECISSTHQCDLSVSTCVNSEGDYDCQCNAGYQHRPSNKRKCYNINECSRTPPVCDQLCVDNEGSYICLCVAGYLLNRDTNKCVDINECSEGHLNECSPKASCVNLNGTYDCICASGFEGNGFVCNDYNECLNPSHGCGQSCINTYGSHECGCVEGYRPNQQNPKLCDNYNECIILPTQVCHQNCTDKEGSFKCFCDQGFSINPQDNTDCLAKEPCDEPCSGGVCIVIDGVKTCRCNQGYQKNSAPLDACLDIDECSSSDTNLCDTDNKETSCVNTDGGYKCTCTSGYHVITTVDDQQKESRICVDTNECLSVSSCNVMSSDCVNTNGGYKCVCRDGYRQATPLDCVDIDECDIEQHRCHKYAECVNLPGSYGCRCLSGFRGDGLECIDIDECSIPGASTCNSDIEVCENSRGGYGCKCKTGYKTDIRTKRCVDINECASPTLNKCTYTAGCQNTVGSYKCTCRSGSVLQNDKITCKPINECSNAGNCKGFCMHVNGTDTCICSYPYDEDCVDINECEFRNKYDLLDTPCDETHSTCINEAPFFQCKCEAPWILDIDHLGCSETNGLWGEWTSFSNCSSLCHGRITRTRICNNPPPLGFKRTCEGFGFDYEMCNVDQTKCPIPEEKVEHSALVSFNQIEGSHWESISKAFFKAVISSINKYCTERDAQYEECCGHYAIGSYTNKKIGLYTDLDVVTGYPRDHGVNGSRVMINLPLSDNNNLCNQNNNRRRREAGNDTTDITPTEAPTRMFPKNTLLRILNLTTTRNAVRLSFDHEDILDIYTDPSYIAIEAYDEDAANGNPTSEPKSNDPPLPVWGIAIVACVGGIGLIILVCCCIFKCTKNNKTTNAGRVSPMSIEEDLRCESKLSVVPPLFIPPPTPDMYVDQQDDSPPMSTPPSPAPSVRTLNVREAVRPHTPMKNNEGLLPPPARLPPLNKPENNQETEDKNEEEPPLEENDLNGSRLSVRSGSALIVPDSGDNNPEEDNQGDDKENPVKEDEEAEEKSKKKKKKKKKSGHKSPKLD